MGVDKTTRKGESRRGFKLSMQMSAFASAEVLGCKREGACCRNVGNVFASWANIVANIHPNFVLAK
jgi:hypothetical protein